MMAFLEQLAQQPLLKQVAVVVFAAVCFCMFVSGIAGLSR